MSDLTQRSAAGGQRISLATLNAYVALTKPRIIWLLLTTTLASMLLAARGLPSFSVLALTLVGGALGAGGASAINNYLDRDIDQLMRRTSTRPIPAGIVSPTAALRFGIGLLVAAFAVLAVGTNALAAVLMLAGALFYILVYTKWLKRSSVQNIVIGGAAGAVPPLVGWAAVNGNLAPLPLLLFGLIFIWTPPHFWALSLLLKDEYQLAHIPMLPAVRGEAETHRQILAYSVAMVALTEIIGVTQSFGALYLGTATLLGAAFLALGLRLHYRGGAKEAWQLFGFSIAYLALIFTAMVADRLWP